MWKVYGVSLEDDICYIHKVAFVKKELEEPIPFAGIIKFVEYKCPICQTTSDSIRDYKTE